jgi:hypothetical protein
MLLDQLSYIYISKYTFRRDLAVLAERVSSTKFQNAAGRTRKVDF